MSTRADAVSNARQGAPPRGVLDRALSLFADVRGGEGVTAVLLMLNIFLLLAAYYLLKTIREPLILTVQGGAEVKSYSAAAIAGLLGILRSGGVVVPLDPSLPKNRLATMLADARVRILLSDRPLQGFEPLDRSHQLHAVVRGQRLPTRELPFLVAHAQQHAPAAGARVAAAGAVGEQLDFRQLGQGAARAAA